MRLKGCPVLGFPLLFDPVSAWVNPMKSAVLTCLAIVFGVVMFGGTAGAQEADAFLACADIRDRNERLACLDEALNDATRERTPMPRQEADTSSTAVEDFGEAPARVTATGAENEVEDAAEDGEENAEKGSLFRLPRISIFRRGQDDADAEDDQEAVAGTEDEDRLENFGRGAPRVVVNEDGEEELNDVITELFLAQPSMWLIRLESGQVWRQVHPKRLNLREGDPVRIYPTGWGDNFRLETSRLSGYIQVLRVE